MAKTKVFVSFDFDHDRALEKLILGQARLPQSPFEVTDHSLKEATRQSLWEAKARTAISRADVCIVILGPRTKRAPGVRKEIAMALELGKPRFQLIGYPAGTREWAVPGGGRTYRWTWANLERLLASPPSAFVKWFLGS